MFVPPELDPVVAAPELCDVDAPCVPLELCEPDVEVEWEELELVEVEFDLEGSLQERSYSGLPFSLTPNEGDAPPSARIYHQKSTLRRCSSHETSCQKVSALSTLAMAKLDVLPATGQPASVIQIGLPPATLATLSYASKNSLPPFSILLVSVVWK